MSFDIRVYYADTDAGGVVYHSKYLDFCEKARTEFLREKGILQPILLEKHGIAFVVKNAEIEFKKAAKLDDLLTVESAIIKNDGLIITMKQEIFNQNNDLIFKMNICLLCVNREFKVMRIPKEIMNILV